MAINLWTLSGNKDSYSPLPKPVYVDNTLVNLKSLVLSFTAYSPSGATIGWGNNQRYEWQEVLTSTPKKYVEEFTPPMNAKNNYIREVTSKGDVVITDIELVEKSTGKATINGVDGFLSGRWSIHANAKVIDDRTVEVNPTGLYQACIIEIPVSSNTEYTITWEGNALSWIKEIKTSTWLGTSIANQKTFTTPLGAEALQIQIQGGNVTSGNFVCKNLRLNLGSTPAPYSKKTGDRMVAPVPKGKNLLDLENILKFYYGSNYSEEIKDGKRVARITSHANIYQEDIMKDFKENTQYTLSAEVYQELLNNVHGFYFKVEYTDDTSTVIVLNGDNAWKTTVFTTKKGKTIKRLTATYGTSSASTYINLDNFQIEEGSVSTEYEPYAVAVNEKSKVKVPKKNLFEILPYNVVRIGSNEIVKVENESIYAETPIDGYGVILGKFSVKENTMYTVHLSKEIISGYDKSVGLRIHFVNQDTYSSSNGDSFTFNSGENSEIRILYYTGDTYRTQIASSLRFYNIQFEEGSVATSYEPYELITPRAEKGLVFDNNNIFAEHSSLQDLDIELDFEMFKQSGSSYNMLWSNSGGSANYIAVRSTGELFVSMRTLYDDVNAQRTWGTGYQIEYNTRYKIRVHLTDGVMKVYSNGVLIAENETQFRGTLYKYSGSVIGAYTTGSSYPFIGKFYRVKVNDFIDYDFTNPNNIIGDKIIPNAENLIPSFDDERWQLHSSARIYGKDVLVHDNTPLNQHSYIEVPVKPNTRYIAFTSFSDLTQRWNVARTASDSSSGTTYTGYTPSIAPIEFTTDNDEESVFLNLYAKIDGTFEFVKPHLYEIPSTAGVINGKPTQRLKAPKRKLFAKR